MNDELADSQSRPSDALRDELRLALIPGVGPRMRQSLLEHFGSPHEIFAAAPSQLRLVPGVGPKLAKAICRAEEIDVDAEIELCEQHDITIITSGHPQYPRLLREICDPPGVLFVHGEITASDAMSIAIVGTRHATSYGLDQAARLAGGLARAGLTIVSGLARGIDAAAHTGALKAGGRTLAVLGSGVLNIYPGEHVNLADQVRKHGAVISENSPHAAPRSGSFPQRNRIITGISLGTIVVEAAERSGALISARLAMEQGREVFAVPGRVDQRNSRGCHRLIRDGAKLVETVDDVLEELGPLVESTPQPDGRTIHHPAELQLNELERAVLDAVSTEPTDMDTIMASSGLPIHRVLATISVLEMRRLIRRVSGNLVVRL